MKRWTIETVADNGTLVIITGTSENRRTPKSGFSITMQKNVTETGTMMYHRGTITEAVGVKPEKAKELVGHLAATHQLKAGVTVAG